jgi:alpha-galactosidase
MLLLLLPLPRRWQIMMMMMTTTTILTQADPKLWPGGIDETISYVHSLGLKFGLYGDRGTLDCAKMPGADGHEVADANYMAKHKVDWYKEDSCYAPGDANSAFEQYGKMRDAL